MRPSHIASFCAMLLVGVSMHADGAPRHDPLPNVRPLQVIGGQLLERGAEGSQTFRRLLAEVEGSDLIVYIDVRPDLPSNLGGLMRFVAATATHRIVKVLVNGRHDWRTMVAMLGHELQHCVEMAVTPRIRSERAMRAFYEQEGLRLTYNRYDSQAAQEVGRAVRHELTTHRPDLRLVRADRETEERLLSGGSIGDELMP